MKRFIALLLSMLCLLSLTACGAEEPQGTPEPTPYPYADAPAKPVIYLYPEEETDVTVQLDFNGTLTTTYPAYNGGWTITAQPDGTLTYYPEAGFTGTVTVTFTYNEGLGDSKLCTATITVE